MSKSRLVTDVGGTNSRFGLARDGRLDPATLRSYRNDDFDSFRHVAITYQTDVDCTAVDHGVLAIGGPVFQQRGRLTNRDWHFDTSSLHDIFGGRPIDLINDLTALGYAVHALDSTSFDRIIDAAPNRDPAGQALVVGVGTGFNVSPVLRNGSQVACAVSEYGHVALPQDVLLSLSKNFSITAPDAMSIEQVFSGRGYRWLETRHAALKAAGSIDFPEAYAELLALLTRGLILAFLPRDGVFFSGSVARNLLAGAGRARFVEVMAHPLPIEIELSAPVMAILDDSAALVGCARYAPPPDRG